jgi:hypothetical protein
MLLFAGQGRRKKTMERQRGPEINSAGHYSLSVPAAEHILLRGGKSVGDENYGGD